MSYEKWLGLLRSAEKTSMISGRERKISYTFPDGQRMVEEYSLDTGVVLRRAWRRSKQLMGEPDWEVELGEPMHPINSPSFTAGAGGDSIAASCVGRDANAFVMKESNAAPILSKRITKRNIEWRIRNMPYPSDVYQVKADPTKQAIIVSTTNKKYYKVITVVDLERCGVVPEQANITTHFQYNTLIITYKKPAILCEMEAKILVMLKDVVTETAMNDILKGLLAK